MDRKYRQHGYMDKEKEKVDKSNGQPQSCPRSETFGPRALNMPAAHSLSRCAECGNILRDLAANPDRCPKCGFTLHSCKQCTHFDPSSHFECRQPVPERISPKDAVNTCTFYAIRVMVRAGNYQQWKRQPADSRIFQWKQPSGQCPPRL